MKCSFQNIINSKKMEFFSRKIIGNYYKLLINTLAKIEIKKTFLKVPNYTKV